MDVLLDFLFGVVFFGVPIIQTLAFCFDDLPGSQPSFLIGVGSAHISPLYLCHKVYRNALDFAHQSFFLFSIFFIGLDDLSHSACIVLHALEFARVIAGQSHEDLIKAVDLFGSGPDDERICSHDPHGFTGFSGLAGIGVSAFAPEIGQNSLGWSELLGKTHDGVSPGDKSKNQPVQFFNRGKIDGVGKYIDHFSFYFNFKLFALDHSSSVSSQAFVHKIRFPIGFDHHIFIKG